jgi:hypothetical protein
VAGAAEVDGEPGEEEPGESGDAELAEVYADEHALAEQPVLAPSSELGDRIACLGAVVREVDFAFGYRLPTAIVEMFRGIPETTRGKWLKSLRFRN